MTADELVERVAAAEGWDQRVAVVRSVPEAFGLSAQQDVYAAIARRVYVPQLAPDYAYVHWRPEYELPEIEAAYAAALTSTANFTLVDLDSLQNAILDTPVVLRIFRLILGLTAQEFAAATALVLSHEPGLRAAGTSRIKSIESGTAPPRRVARACALVVDKAMRRQLFGDTRTGDVRLKTDKPDTASGWASIQQYAGTGVPLPVFLHQRHYGGAFRQLLDATSSKRGDIIEDAVAELFTNADIPHVRTGAHNQADVALKFGITVKPAPDFVVFDQSNTVRALLECKGANDGGTARDKAARFKSLRAEASRLGGVPLFAVLAGLGWTRTGDALGPVIRDTDGRTFTLATLGEMLTVQPFPSLLRTIF